MFKKILIANRGEIALRLIKACHRLAIKTVAIYSTIDREAEFVKAADEAMCIGPSPANESYLNREAILMVSKLTHCDAVHPGYGFLSEDPIFATMVQECDITWIGPTVNQMQQFGDKEQARLMAQKRSVPVIPGTDVITELEQIPVQANRIGYPVLIKASFGGGGKGIRFAKDERQLKQELTIVQKEAQASFGAAELYLERNLQAARHIEVQVLGMDQRIIILGDRDCSMQNHRQKVIEESPAQLTEVNRAQLYRMVHQLLDDTGYQSLGTVEFLQFENQFYFLEMNTRLQVEHGVTEETSGIDIVQTQIKVAAGIYDLVKVQDAQTHAIEVRINAQTSGMIQSIKWPSEARVESGYQAKTSFPPFYDALLAKIITTGNTRQEAITKMQVALSELEIDGIQTNQTDVQRLLASSTFKKGNYHTESYRQILNAETR